jgi:hypothetical protein
MTAFGPAGAAPTAFEPHTVNVSRTHHGSMPGRFAVAFEFHPATKTGFAEFTADLAGKGIDFASGDVFKLSFTNQSPSPWDYQVKISGLADGVAFSRESALDTNVSPGATTILSIPLPAAAVGGRISAVTVRVEGPVPNQRLLPPFQQGTSVGGYEADFSVGPVEDEATGVPLPAGAWAGLLTLIGLGGIRVFRLRRARRT